MSVEVDAKKISTVAKEGFERLSRYRRARAAFIKDYCGQYYNALAGLSGEMPINLIFLALRILVPNLVQKEGINKVTTEILAHKEYGELQGLALDRLQRQLKMKNILRAGIVDMCFALSIFKTSIAASGELLPVGNDVNIDPGQIYTSLVDLDDFTFDPLARSFEEAGFLGHNTRIERQVLLDTDGWNHDLVRRLPSAGNNLTDKNKVEQITQRDGPNSQMHQLQDYVNVVELWIPKAEAICYMPNPYQTSFDDFLNITDYYGPAEGPYTFGSLTPPVPNNPLPVAPVGVWRDLNAMANRLMHKAMSQADSQKNVVLYDPAYADVAQAVVDAFNNESIACGNPDAVKVVSFSGQDPANEQMVQSLFTWFNLIAGNPTQMGGMKSPTKKGAISATEVTALQSNAAVVLEDMRDINYDISADISKKQAWYLHTDPLIKVPLIKRETGRKPIQIWLTPEQRQGDWSEYTYKIVKRSMLVLEPNLRAKRIMEFYTNVIPAVMNSALLAMQQGVAFNVPRALMQAAEEMGIADALSEIFDDPTFAKRMEYYQSMGPKDAGKGVITTEGIRQQGGFPMARNILSPESEFNQEAQGLAGIGQSVFGAM